MIYVILTHRSPQLLRRLLLKLKDRDNYFVIHVDKNFNIEPFTRMTADIENCHYTTERYSTYWGSFDLVKATLHAFEYVKDVLRKRQRIVLLSGSDYPIKSKEYIRKYLDSHKDTIFIEYSAIPRKLWNDGGTSRFPLYEDISKEINLFGGSQWFSIPSKALSILFHFLKVNPDFLKYFQYVQIPDESFFQYDTPYLLDNFLLN